MRCAEWVDEQYGNVPSLETLPRVKNVRRTASGAGGGPDSHGRNSRPGVDRHGTSARQAMEAREELKTVASAVQDYTRTPRATTRGVLYLQVACGYGQLTQLFNLI